MTTTTTELPPLAEAMTAADLRVHRIALAAKLNIEATRVHVWTDPFNDANPAVVYIADRNTSSLAQNFNAPTWAQAFSAAWLWAGTEHVVRREATIRRIALAVIDLTDQHGKCDMAMLLRRDFTPSQVRDLHADACVRAGELCAGAPFVVEGVS